DRRLRVRDSERPRPRAAAVGRFGRALRVSLRPAAGRGPGVAARRDRTVPDPGRRDVRDAADRLVWVGAGGGGGGGGGGTEGGESPPSVRLHRQVSPGSGENCSMARLPLSCWLVGSCWALLAGLGLLIGQQDLNMEHLRVTRGIGEIASKGALARAPR